MTLAIAWVWKSNQVKEYYSRMKRLETDKTNMIAENTQITGGPDGFEINYPYQ